MKGKKILVSTLAVALVVATGVSAYAASPEVRDAVGSIFTDVQTYADDEMPALPESAVILDKQEADFEEDISVTLSTYTDDEMPAMPEGAQLMRKAVVEK